MEASFQFRLHTRVHFGPGVSRRLPEFLKEFGFRKLALVVDIGVTGNSTFRLVRKSLCDSFEVVHELVNKVSEPDYDYLEECRLHLWGKSFDCIVGFGGGSSLDLTKALSVLMTNPGRAIEYRGFDRLRNPGIPVIAIPTTAGTGAEVTPNAVFTDWQEKRRLGINTSLYLPKLALLDPLLTVTCPKTVTISSGVDALMQAVESYVARQATPISRLFSMEAFRLVFHALPKVVSEPDDVKLRADMQLGAYYSGIALMNSGPGPAGALSYPLGVFYRVPHGLAHAVGQPSIVRWNVEQGCTLYADLYDLIDGADLCTDSQAKSISFCQRLAELYSCLDIPQTLTPFGVRREGIPFLAEQVFLLKQAVDSNPVEISLRDVTGILEGIV